MPRENSGRGNFTVLMHHYWQSTVADTWLIKIAPHEILISEPLWRGMVR